MVYHHAVYMCANRGTLCQGYHISIHILYIYKLNPGCGVLTALLMLLSADRQLPLF